MALGVDLSVNLPATGLCRLDVGIDCINATFPDPPESDSGLLDLIQREPDVVGIDVPLGWPIDFARAVGRYTADASGEWAGDDNDFTAAYYRYRITDKAVVQYSAEHGVKISPLSVSADKLGAPAMKAAWLMTALRRRDRHLRFDRTGLQGPIVEVYPAAAIKLWQLDFPKYKGLRSGAAAARLQVCLDRLAQSEIRLSGLDRAQNEHQLDALVCALVALAAREGLTVQPQEDVHDFEVLSVEGWIHVPLADSLGELDDRLLGHVERASAAVLEEHRATFEALRDR